MKLLLRVVVTALALAVSPRLYAQATGLPQQTVAAIERLLTEKMAEEHIPGLSIAIVVDGDLVWSRGYGLADLENYVPATARTAYRTASIGNPLTATAVLRLAEQGWIDLDS